MRPLEFVRRCRWLLIGMLLVYLGVALWLYFATQDPGDAPFVYQVF